MTIDLNSWEEFAKPVATALCLGLFWSWETVSPFFEFKVNRWKHAGRNVFVAISNTVVLGLLFGVVTVAVANWAESYQWGLLNWAQLSSAWRVVVAVLMLDGWLYIWHRLNHSIPLLWRFHRMHHSDLAMDVTSATRFHLGELIASATVRLGLIPLLGVNAIEILVSETIVVAVTMFHHANISLGKFDSVLRWLMVTPGMHKIHHSRVCSETDSNYSVFFSIWDRIGSTFRTHDQLNQIQLGLPEYEDEKWQTIAGMLKTPFCSTNSEHDAAPEDSLS